MYVLSGDMDPLQAGTNGTFGTFDMGIRGADLGTGTIAGDYDDVTNILNYLIEWMKLTTPVTNMHFHDAAVGDPGGVDLSIPAPWLSPEIGTGIVLTDPQEINLLSGNWYVNVHTSNFGGGEIRGQVIVAPVPIPAAVWLFASAIAGIRLMRRRGV